MKINYPVAKMFFLGLVRSPFKSYLASSFVLIVMLVSIGYSKFYKPLRVGLDTLSEEIKQVFPVNLEIEITSSGVYSNSEFPIIIPMPNSLRGFFGDNFIIIDPDLDEYAFNSYSTLMVMNNRDLIARTSGGLSIVSLEHMPRVRITYKDIILISTRLKELAEISHYIVIAFFMFSTMINTFVIWPAYVLATSFFAKLVLKKRKFNQILRVNFHAVSLLILLIGFLQVLGFRIRFFPWFTVTHVLCVYLVVYFYRKFGWV